MLNWFKWMRDSLRIFGRSNGIRGKMNVIFHRYFKCYICSNRAECGYYELMVRGLWFKYISIGNVNKFLELHPEMINTRNLGSKRRWDKPPLWRQQQRVRLSKNSR